MNRNIVICALWFSLIFLMLCFINPAAAQVDQQRAETYFKEVTAICQRDSGRLWGISLCGPMVFADARTKTLATSQPRPADNWPHVLGHTNAPLEWGGARWVTYMWDFTVSLPTPRVRHEFMLHELFHRIQADLGLMPIIGKNAHLDAIDARIWLQLEWRALTRALGQSGEIRKCAVSDALAFRHARRSLFANAAENERVEEIREGLAQYTGIIVTADSRAEAITSTIENLDAAKGHETFLQQAYVTGTAYAVLLDDASANWRRNVTSSSDLGQLLMAALGIKPTEDTAAASEQYGGKRIRSAEHAREKQRKARMLELRNRFIDGPVLLVPSGGGATFNAVGATPIPGVGTVFVQPYRTKGEWGTLEATNGILIGDDGKRQLPGPFRIEGANISGEGWTVTVASGWTLRPGPRSGDYQIVRNP